MGNRTKWVQGTQGYHHLDAKCLHSPVDNPEQVNLGRCGDTDLISLLG